MNTTKELAVLLKVNAYNLYKATLVGNPAPYVRELGEELRNPKTGDLVMETTTHLMQSQDPVEGIGRLIRIEERPICTPEEAAANGYEEGEEIPTRKVWYLRLVFDDGREFRWTNASFIKIKEDNA